MREKTLRFMTLTLAPFEQTVENLVGDWRNNFKKGFGEPLPAEALETLRIIENALNGKRAELENQTAAIYEGKFSEEDINSIVSYLESPVGRKLADVSLAIKNEMTEASNRWLNAILKTIEPDLSRLLDSAPSSIEQELKTETPAEPL